MMSELYNYGPFVVSFEPDYNFMLYKNGIYHSVTSDSFEGIAKPEWEKVDHSVLLVGWGVDEATGENFWLIQNTWGSQWGEDGYFRLRRGVDESAIESTCEAGTPIIIDNKTNLHLLPNVKNIDLVRKYPMPIKRLNLIKLKVSKPILKMHALPKFPKNTRILTNLLAPY